LEGFGLLDRDRTEHVHFVGIGGIGLSAIARVLHGDGYVISGSDSRRSELTEELASLGMVVHHGHSAANVLRADLVVASSAVPPDNPEVVAAREAGVPVVKRARILGEMTASKFAIAVAGTHGKTTTSAFISFVLCEADLDPTFVVGGILQGMNTNARRGEGPHFVIEADEYDCTFLGLRPQLAVVTVIEMDHPDFFADIEDVIFAFRRFALLLPAGGTLVGCADQPRVVQLLQEVGKDGRIDVVAYGMGRQGAAMWPSLASESWTTRDVRANAWGGSDFLALRNEQAVGECQVRLPGVHNVSNTLAVLAVAGRLGLDMDRVLAALPRFYGVRRRFEVKGEVGGIVVVDDYAHHPTEIRATLAAARRRYGGRPLWVFFQPHTYSRTKALLDEFAASFGHADHVLVSEIYAARETDNLGIAAHDLVSRIDHPDVRYVATLRAASDHLQAALRAGDVLLTLGAGDGYLVGESLLARHSGAVAAEAGNEFSTSEAALKHGC
jgi:UDP-N-acetylmuramate--alanine ligase